MIESLQNQKIKYWMKLKRKKDRMKANAFLIEGEHLVEEAIKSNWYVKEIIMAENYEHHRMNYADYPITVVSSKVFTALASTEHPQGIMAEVEMKNMSFSNQFRKMVLLDAIQDPGNVGTIIRTADAFGFDGVILGTGTVDLYNEKVIRASQGSIFHLPIFSGPLENWLKSLKEQDFVIWATSLSHAKDVKEVTIPKHVGIIFGNEGKGVNPSLLEQADERVYLPISGQAESLNVSIAAGIFMYILQN
jgi:RNA methyltransferase, TrmH family